MHPLVSWQKFSHRLFASSEDLEAGIKETEKTEHYYGIL
jgi:hypothetical protein